MNINQTTKKGSGIIGLFIGLTVLFFVLLVALFLLKVVLGIFFALAPLAGLIVAGYGGWRYTQADVEAEKLSAMSVVAVGLGIAFLGVLF